MGEMMVGHLMNEAPDWAQLRQAPPQLGVRVYYWPDEKLWFLDTYPADRVPKYPLLYMIEEVQLSPDVVQQAVPFQRVAALLGEMDIEGAEAHGTLNTGLQIAKLLQKPVFSFVSDDDTLSFCSVYEGTSIRRIRHVRSDLDIEYENGKLTIYPLVFPKEEFGMEDEELDFLTDEKVLESLSRIPNVEVRAREREVSLELHDVLYQEAHRFLGRDDFELPTEQALELVFTK